MERRISILFIMMLLFQSMSGGLVGLVDAASAVPITPDDENHLQLVSITDDANESEVNLEGEFAEDTAVNLIFAWQLAAGSNELVAHMPADLSEQLVIAEQTGTLLFDEAEIGAYEVDAEGKIVLTLTEELGAHGEIVVTALIEGNNEEKPTEIAEAIKGSEEEVTKENKSTENTVNLEEEKQDNNPVEETEKATENSESVEDADINTLAGRTPHLIEENIIDAIRLKYKDGSAFEDDDLIGVDEDLRFELDWSLPNENDYIDGDYFEFQLPEQLTVINKIENGDLDAYGTFDLGLDGKVRFTFNDKVERESNIKGTFWFETQLEEKTITTTEETINIVFNGKVVQKIIINVKPTGGQAITKEGQPVNGNFNTEEVLWTVVVNTTRESLKNAIIKDPILAGQELILDSVVLKEVEVNLAGEVTKELEEVSGFTNTSTVDNLNIELGNTNKAYKLVFKTKLLADQFKEGTTTYENTAYLTSDGIKDAQAGGSVSVSRPKSLEKTSSKFNEEGRFIEWTVKANFTEQNLEKGDVITDEFTFTVGNDVIDAFEVKLENIEVSQVDEFNSEGKATAMSDAKSSFDITVDGNKVTYKLKEATNKAFILKYKTTANCIINLAI